MGEEKQRGEELFDKLSRDKKKRRRRVIRTVILVLVLVAVALVATVIVLRRNVEARFAAAAAEVQAYTVSTGTIHTVVAGTGVLTELDLEDISVPAGVEITEVAVEAGDQVVQGDLLATVDMATVMTALSDVQKQIGTLDKQISDAKGDEVSGTVYAGVAGRVKKIYAKKDQDVSLCMAGNGALAVLSLDGYMAVDLQTDQLAAGDKVTVIRANGSKLKGKVESAAGGKATVLVTDDGPKLDEEVTVLLSTGSEIGTGRLYIHNPLAVTGYAGTIRSVNIKENAKVKARTILFQLKNTSFSANYDSLLRDRADLEEIQMDLLALSRDRALLAPMDGRISTVIFDTDTSTIVTGVETQILQLYPGREMSITISIDENDIMALKEGQTAQVKVTSVSEEESFPAKVTEISKVADTSSGVTRYAAEVTLDKADGMLAGMTADVDIQIEGVENALIIPIDALHRTRATYFVYTSYDQELKQYGGRKDVVIGMQNDTQVEILSGLQQGDVIYYTEAPQDIFSFMMGQMGGSQRGGMPMGQSGRGNMPGGMNGRPGAASGGGNRGG